MNEHDSEFIDILRSVVFVPDFGIFIPMREIPEGIDFQSFAEVYVSCLRILNTEENPV